MLESRISQNGGRIATSPNYILVPFSMLANPLETGVHVSEFWIEKCIQANRLVEQTESVLFSPTRYPLPFAGLIL